MLANVSQINSPEMAISSRKSGVVTEKHKRFRVKISELKLEPQILQTLLFNLQHVSMFFWFSCLKKAFCYLTILIGVMILTEFINKQIIYAQIVTWFFRYNRSIISFNGFCSTIYCWRENVPLRNSLKGKSLWDCSNVWKCTQMGSSRVSSGKTSETIVEVQEMNEDFCNNKKCCQIFQWLRNFIIHSKVQGNDVWYCFILGSIPSMRYCLICTQKIIWWLFTTKWYKNRMKDDPCQCSFYEMKIVKNSWCWERFPNNYVMIMIMWIRHFGFFIAVWQKKQTCRCSQYWFLEQRMFFF